MMTKWAPNQKVQTGGIAGALSVALVWLWNTFLYEYGELDATTAAAFAWIITAGLAYLKTEG